MALDIFDPPGRFLAGPSVDTNPRTNSAQFGDGYSQRSEDGLNAEPQIFTGQLENLSPSQARSVLAFFRAHTSKPFLWALPDEEFQRKWIAAKWPRSFPLTGRSSISFTFTEVFDL